MKGIRLTAPWEVGCVDIAMPTRKSGEALIRVKAVGICGSDIGAFRGVNKLVSYPRIIGHEIAGEIIEIDENNPKGFKAGDRVVVDPYIYCNHCYPCSIGRTNCCEDLHVLGVHVDGGMIEYYSHPDNMLVAIPDDMDWVEASMAEPLTISLHGIHRGKINPGEYCAIIGAGTIGLAAGLVAQAYRGHAILIDIVQERLDFAKKLGIEHVINSKNEDVLATIKKITGGNFAPLVMECSGANPAIRSTLDYVSFAGRITLTGWPKNETSLPTDIITKKELDILGARTSAGELDEALALMDSKKVDMMKLLTKTVTVDEASGILQDIEKYPDKYMKVVITF